MSVDTPTRKVLRESSVECMKRAMSAVNRGTTKEKEKSRGIRKKPCWETSGKTRLEEARRFERVKGEEGDSWKKSLCGNRWTISR